MKCPKCGYLGFESGDRCRNCGYEFSLSADTSDPLDLPLDLGPDESKPPLDLDRIIGAPESSSGEDLPLFDDAPLITGPLRPRQPLGVRRATPEIPRARARETKPAAPADMLFESASEVVARPFEGGAISKDASSKATGREALAGALSRILAALIDVALLFALDGLVLYFTLRLVGLGTDQVGELPLLPLIAFILLLNVGYFIAFTTVGGQSIGKMAFGIKVISEEESAVPIGRATLRTLAYFVSALPLGAGFLPGVISADRLALHDRLAHTRVVRPSST
jgi:uncharacterized RDD family membrane protein YckC